MALSINSPFRFSRRELALVITVTFPVIGTLFPLDSYLASSAGGFAGLVSKSPLNTTLILAVTLTYILWLFARNVPKAMKAFKRNWLLFALLLWSFATSRWAADPGGSFNRTGRMLVFTLYAVYLIEFIPYRRALQLLATCLALSCLCSLALIVVAPSLSYTIDMRGAWRGAMMHKNVMGGMAGMTFLVAVVGWRIKLFSRMQLAGLASLSVLLLLLANSATALLSVFLISSVLWFLTYVVNNVRHPLALLSFTILLAGVAAWFVISTDIIFDLLGRDASLTGRAEVWEFTHYMIDEKPFWGWGNSTWGDPDFQDMVMRYLHWPAPHAHNGWLDFRLQLGMPGLILAIIIWTVAAFHIVYAIGVRRVPEMALPIGVFLSLSIRSYSETIVVDPSLNEMFWLAFSYAALVALPARERAKCNTARASNERVAGSPSLPMMTKTARLRR